jgi:tight adherence protein C
MIAIVLPIILFVALMAGISYFGYRRYARPARVYEQLGGEATFAMPTLDRKTELDPGLAVRVFEEIGEKIPINPEDASMVRRDLIAAGYRSERALPMYLASRVVGCAGMLLLGLLVRGYIDNPILSMVVPIGMAFLGYYAPSMWLDSAVSNRNETLRFSLPDGLDLMVVSVEAGLGLDQAIQYVAKEMVTTHPELSEELQIVTLEIRAGKRRPEALRNLANRTGEPELSKLVAILIQTDRFGTSIAESLRTHSEFMRTRRRQEAEERAAKVGVKLVFPIFFLMLPAMLVVAAGPGLLQVFKYLFPMMKKASF